MRLRTAATLLTLVALASISLAAQEQRGSIEGTIVDTTGGVVPGVTVEARSPALIGTAVSVTSATGT